MTNDELKAEMRGKKFKVRGKTRDDMISLLSKEDTCQMKIVWGEQQHIKEAIPNYGHRGKKMRLEEEMGSEEAVQSTSEGKEDNGVDVLPEGEASGREATEEDSPKSGRRRLGQPTVLGRPRGIRKRRYWVKKREAQVKQGSNPIESEGGSNQVPDDSKCSRVNRVKGGRPGEKNKSEPSPSHKN